MVQQTLTVNQIKTAAMTYYKAKRLIAQGKTKVRLAYTVLTRRCAISAAFTDETMRALKARGLQDGACTEGLVTIVPSSDLLAVQAIQNAHDEWATTGSRKAKANFLSLLH